MNLNGCFTRFSNWATRRLTYQLSLLDSKECHELDFSDSEEALFSVEPDESSAGANELHERLQQVDHGQLKRTLRIPTLPCHRTFPISYCFHLP